ncbi:MAG: deoxyribose-phosphate aldolase [Paraglaciecola sp.]|jgi:deoxyribose-phosphate aldolase
MSLARKIDHTILKADCTPEDIVQLCHEALEYEFAAVCVPPYYIKQAVNILEDSMVSVATVIGFPMGYSNTPSKVEEIKRAIDEGIDEVDVVINIAAVKDGNWNFVKNDVDSTTRAAHLKGKVVKIILETDLLTTEEIEKICEICSAVGVNYVKNSTGFNGGATVEIISTLRNLLHEDVKIKASGGIRTKVDAENLVAAGADRLGSSSGVQIVGEA